MTDGFHRKKEGKEICDVSDEASTLLFNTPVPEDGDSRGLFGGINQDQENFSVSISIS